MERISETRREVVTSVSLVRSEKLDPEQEDCRIFVNIQANPSQAELTTFSGVALAQTTRKVTRCCVVCGCVCMCVCVCVCLCVYFVCFALSVVCCVVFLWQNTRKATEKNKKTGLKHGEHSMGKTKKKHW